MTTLIRLALLALLVIALVGYCLPWFTWTNRTTLVYSESFKQGLSGLPDDLYPRDSYDSESKVRPLERALSISANQEIDEQPMAVYGQLLPHLHFGPRTTTTGRGAFGVSWLMLVLASGVIVGRRFRLALVFLLVANAGVIIGVAAESHGAQYFSHATDQKIIELPQQFQLTFDMAYHVTWCFWLTAVSLIATIPLVLYLIRRTRFVGFPS